MAIKIEKILDISFALFIFSIIVIPMTKIGRLIQVLFLICGVVLLNIKRIKFTKFSFFEFLFFGYTIIQYLFNITVLKESSLSMSKTILYNAIFSLVMISYLIYKNDFKKFSELYAKATLYSFLILILFYFQKFFSGRFSTSEIISIWNIKMIGGQSATSLSIIAAIPCFFLVLFEDQNHKKRNFFYTIMLFIISFATGTRKTLLIFAFLFFIVYPLKRRKVNIFRFAKIAIGSLIAIFISVLLCYKIDFLYNIIGYRIEGFVNSINAETESIADDSVRVRHRMIDKSKELISQKKTYGWGMDYFRASGQNNLGYYSHNNFTEILVGGGIVGFIIFYAKYIILLIPLIYSKNIEKEKKIFLILFLIIMTILEYWQVMYIYRFIIIYQAIIYAYIYTSKCNSIKQEDLA